MSDQTQLTFSIRIPLQEDEIMTVKHYTDFLLKLIADAEVEKARLAKEAEERERKWAAVKKAKTRKSSKLTPEGAAMLGVSEKTQ